MLTDLRLGYLDIPFRMSFRHASAERSRTHSLWVEARSIGGRVGYGESCPRSYVTGESKHSAREFFLASRRSLLDDVDSVQALMRWIRVNRNRIDENPAAWCAVELALLDLLARERDEPVEATLGLSELHGSFRYSAVVGDCDLDTFTNYFDRYWNSGFRDFKLKLCGRFDRDSEKIEWLRANAMSEIRLRVDANNLWRDVAQATDYLRALNFPLFAIEEPLEAGRFSGLAKLARALDTRIILDESLTRAGQLHHLEGDPARWIVNLRISKAGGLIRSLELLEALRRRRIAVIVGAQVGETSLLSRAALTVAVKAADLLIAQEGAFGTLLLEQDVCRRSLMFGHGGILNIPGQVAPGFGIDVTLPRHFVTPIDQPRSEDRTTGRPGAASLRA